LGGASLAMFLWLLASYGVRGIFLERKQLRVLLLALFFCLIGAGGYRSAIIQAVLIFIVLFFMERLHRTPLVLVLLLLGALLTAGLVPFAARLPFVIQRSLAFLPLPLSPEAVSAAEGSSDWRINMWTSLLPEVPQHFWLGKGYAVSVETFNEMMSDTALATAQGLDGSQQSLALSGDYHNGPLSVVLSFGIWGTIAFIWFVGAAIWVLYRNYRNGAPALLTMNRFLFAYYLVKVGMFVFVFGDMSADMIWLSGYVGFSIALNHGVCHPERPLELGRSNNEVDRRRRGAHLLPAVPVNY